MEQAAEQAVFRKVMTTTISGSGGRMARLFSGSAKDQRRDLEKLLSSHMHVRARFPTLSCDMQEDLGDPQRARAELRDKVTYGAEYKQPLDRAVLLSRMFLELTKFLVGCISI